MKISKNFATNKLKIQKKQLSAAIAFVLTLTIAATFITALPVAFGQFLPNARESHLYCSAAPNPVGKGQNVFIVGWIYPPPSDNWRIYYNVTLTITSSLNLTEPSSM